ncbi:MAG: hypothetical protein ACXVEE_01620 [Polyangiales bacterium]
MRLALSALGSVILVVSALSPREAHAGAAWGDVSLKSDDVRVEVDASGHADVTHTVGLHVAAKKFRAFVIEGVDATIEPPADEATLAGRDGPGWPITATDAKGQAVEAFVEPAGAPGRLRVRFGPEGVGRGDFTVRIRYRVDLVKHGTFVREGAMAKLAWATPRWPEGYDGAHFVFSVPAAPTEPRVSIADSEGDGEHPPEGVAVVAIHRSPTRDEVEITRPHVPQGESTRFVLRIDPKAFPGIGTMAAPVETRENGLARATPRGRGVLAGAAAFAAFALGLVLRRRDTSAEREGFRPLLPVSGPPRAALYAALSGVGVAATFGGHALLGAGAVLGAIACATLRAPPPDGSTRAPGRWLAIPEEGIPALRKRARGLFERPWVAAIVFAAIAIAAFFMGRRDIRAAVAILVVATPLIPLFATGRGSQLPPDLVSGAWSRLSAIAAALRAKRHTPKIIARTAATIDELRLRIDGTRHGVRSIEIGCAMVHASGGTALVPEVLVRFADGTAAARAATAHAESERDGVLLLGRVEGERVLALRPADVAPAAIVRAVELGLALGAVAETRLEAAPREAAATKALSQA